MLVNNKTLHITTIPYRVHSGTAQGTDVRDSFSLFPGVNEVPDEQWSKAKKIAVVADRVEEGDYHEIEGSITKFTPTRAKSLIKDTYLKDLLDRWRSEDTRADVRKAIDQQIEKISLSDEDRAKARGE